MSKSQSKSKPNALTEVLFWFRRDLRLEDNAGLYRALKSGYAVRGLFIFDRDILDQLPHQNDFRMPFLLQQVLRLQTQLREQGSDLEIHTGLPAEIFKQLLTSDSIKAVYTNHDYEPYALIRDQKIAELCKKKGREFLTFKDQVIFEKEEVLTDQRRPYTVYTPYKKKWLASLSPFYLRSYPSEKYCENLRPGTRTPARPTLTQLGFTDPKIQYPEPHLSPAVLKDYEVSRNIPAQTQGTSHLGIHLRFGTLSIRQLAQKAKPLNAVWLSELIWREFFMQILHHFPQVQKTSFRPEFENVAWRRSQSDFDRWTAGQTGYPLVDAGMRQLVTTGYMHNRVRMVTASFLCKHLLQHWSRGEAHFAGLLLDYELASNNGNWQWAAGTGCDAAPYFRIFNPEAQQKRFDPQFTYIKHWVPEWGTSKYPAPMVDHRQARDRALAAFTLAVKGKKK